MNTAEETRLKSPGVRWFKEALDPMFLPQTLEESWLSHEGRLRKEAEAWVVTIVEWPRENYWRSDNSHGFQ